MPRPTDPVVPISGSASEQSLLHLIDSTEGGRTLVDAGKSFMAGSGRLTAAVASNVRATLENPVGSGKVLYVTSFSGFATVLAWLFLRIQPTTGLPAGVRTPANKIIGGPAAAGLMKADLSATTPLGGGTLASTELGLAANRRTEVVFDHPLRLAPGVLLGIGFSLGTAGDGNINVSWFEEDA